jgi:quinohemoprotein ethanol dehydrogenase
MRAGLFLAVLMSVLVVGCGAGEESDGALDAGAGAASDLGVIDGSRVAAADEEPGSWLAHGRTYDEQRFSPLRQINSTNVGDLGLAWSYDTGGTRGHEATPIVVDDRIYLTADWSIVHAIDARTGEQLWKYDPEVPGEVGRIACCDVVNRGVAVWQGRVYLGALDGRLIALNAETGALDWEVQTTDLEKPYTITGAPRIVKGKVVIGNGGAEYGVRGYVSAYDAETGEQAWLFYTVPGNPAEPFEHPEMAAAAETWTGEWWVVGGGGTVWDSMAFDPELDLLYIGVGNGAPWSRTLRSPGGGDNLYLSSIIALRPDTGELIWHYQTTPGDNWDYTAVQHMVLADLDLDGERRKVLMQAPKNGFFYVLDRETGEFLSAEKYVTVNWASHIDPETGRPVETEEGNYDEQPRTILPSPSGGHNWHPMSFSPDTGLVYIPTIELALIYALDSGFDYNSRTWNLGIDISAIPNLLAEMPAPPTYGALKAWDPIEQREVWSVQHAGAFNGGVLSTGGNLVFQGTADGQFAAFQADSGAELWRIATNIGIVAPPISYSVDGEQYIAVLAGWGGNVIVGMDAGISAASTYENPGRLFVFKLDGEEPIPAVRAKRGDFLVPAPGGVLTAQERKGQDLYHDLCAVCHGLLAVSSGVTADLRLSSDRVHENFDVIVRDGELAEQGMASFADVLEKEDVDAIQAYLRMRETEDKEAAAGGQ